MSQNEASYQSHFFTTVTRSSRSKQIRENVDQNKSWTKKFGYKVIKESDPSTEQEAMLFQTIHLSKAIEILEEKNSVKFFAQWEKE